MKTLLRLSAAAILLSLASSGTFPQEVRSSIYILSQPVTVAKLGAQYEYHVVAAGLRSTDVFKYRLSSAPVGMTIDSVKGLVRWKPGVPGTFGVEIVASNQLGEKASQSYKLRVVRFLGAISGNVKGDDGKALQRIIVTLYPQSPPTATNKDFPIPVLRYSVLTDSAGNYTIANVDSGSYYAYAMTYCYMLMSPIPCKEDDYLPVWYKDSPTISGATVIPVKDSNKVQIDFQMHKRPKPVFVSVSGRVTDSSGRPIRGATVAVSAERTSPNILGDDIDPSTEYNSESIGAGEFGWFPDIASSGKTDSLGNYKISVLAGGSYVALSYAVGYLLQYYKEKSNALEANRMTLTKDSAGVNFRLVSVSKATTRISGAVRNADGKGVRSRLILYSRTPVPYSTRESVRSVNTDSLGIFVFEKVADGSYLLFAVPLKDYMPSYYSTKSCGESDWKKADTIAVRGANVVGLVVCVVKGTVRGAGNISGRISTDNGAGLDGVVVSAVSQAEASIATYAISDADGKYELTNLDAGAFQLAADKVGYTGPNRATATVVYQQAGGPMNFQLSRVSVTSVGQTDATVPAEYSLAQNYPNPFNPSTNIRFELPTRMFVKLIIFNALGQEVTKLVNKELEPGVYKIPWDARSQPSGLYFYRLQAGGFVETRKMVFLK